MKKFCNYLPITFHLSILTGSKQNIKPGLRKLFILFLLLASDVAVIAQSTPVINSFISDNGCYGSPVKIIGAHFTGATQVLFGGTPAASFTVNAAGDTITATLGAGATGNITVTNPAGTGTSAGVFRYGQVSIAHSLYTVNYADNTIDEYDLYNNNIVRTISLGSGVNPNGMCVSNDGLNVYISSELNRNVYKLNTITTGITALWTGGFGSKGICISPDGSNVYVANEWDNTVTKTNTLTSLTDIIPVGNNPREISIDPAGGNVYVTNTLDNSISVINTATLAVSTINILTGSNPQGICLNPYSLNAAWLFVLNQSVYGNNSVVFIDPATNAQTTIDVGNGPGNIAVTPDGSLLYVTNSADNTVSVIDVATATVIQTILVGNGPLAIHISKDGSQVFVANQTDNSISIINTATNTVSNTIATGNMPVALASNIGEVVFPCPPVITSFSPSAATRGDTVTIIGKHFSNNMGVEFGNTHAENWILINDSTIKAVVYCGSSGSVRVFNEWSIWGIASAPGFTYLNFSPLIQSFCPSTACTGAAVQISGTLLNLVTRVYFGGVPASSFTVNPQGTLLTAIVGAGASGDITVETFCNPSSTPGFTLPGFTFNNTPVTPAVSITASANNICPGTAVTFTATPVNGGCAPAYQWKKNGSDVGSNSHSYTDASLLNNDVISCVLTSNAGCVSPLTATSNSITMLLNSAPVTLNTNGSNCPGTSVLSLSGANDASQIVWYNGNSAVSIVMPDITYTGTTVAGGNGEGPAANQLSADWGGVFVDAGGNIFVDDVYNHRIQKWAPGATSGVTVAGGNGPGSALNQLNYPEDIYVDAAGNIFVADMLNHRIQKFPVGSTSSTNGITVAGGNGPGEAANQLFYPSSVFVDAAGNIFVAERYTHTIKKWALGATSGLTVAGGNGIGSAANQFDEPASIYVDLNGNIFVADQNNHRIQKWVPGATSGVTVAGGNGYGSAANQLSRPIDVYVDLAGNIFVSDFDYDRIQKWAPGAASGVTVAGGNGQGSAANQLDGPYGIYLDVNGNIFVNDAGNYRIQKWGPVSVIYTSYTPLSDGSYSAVVTNSAGCLVTSNAIIVNPTITPSICITISATTPGPGNSVSFTATPANGGSTPAYQWKKNGSNVGTNSNTYTDPSLANNDVISCVLTSNEICAKPVSATANTLNSNGSNCLGSSVLSLSGAENASQIVWYNGNTIVNTVSSVITGTTVAGGNGAGSAANQFHYTSDVYVDAAGNIFVADYQNSRIQKWAPGATSGVTVAGGNGTGGQDNQLWFPTGVFVDASGNIFISDSRNYRIQKWAPGASSGVTVAGGHGCGYASNQLCETESVYVDADGNIFLADDVMRIIKWAPGAASGAIVAGGNGYGLAANQLAYPIGVSVDAYGNIFVADSYNHRIQKFPPGSSSTTAGVTAAGGHGSGAGANQLFLPNSVFVDRVGNIFVCDRFNNRIQKWAPGATSGVTVAGGNGWGSAANQLAYPRGVFVDASGSIFVADEANHRIQKWASVINTSYTPLTAGIYTAVVTSAAGCTSTSNAVTITNCAVTLNLKAFLEGFCDDINHMRANIFDLGISSDATETDSLQVGLWETANLSNPSPAYSAQTVVHTDGSCSPIQFPATVAGKSFYIQVKHRNHIETWSAGPVLFSPTTSYDFTLSQSQAYDDGFDANPPMAPVAGGKYAIYAGDVNQDGGVDGQDASALEIDVNAFAYGYNTSDTNGDGSSDGLDASVIEVNSNLFIFYSRP